MFTSFRGIESGIQDKLNGAVLCGPFPNAGLPIGGLTLVFSNPADTVTFDGSVGDLVTAKVFIEDVLTILPTFHAEIRPLGSSFYVSIWFDTGFTIAHTGTANSALGLSTTVDTISAGAADPAKVVSFSQGSTSGYYALILSSLAKTFEDTEIQSSGTGWGTSTLHAVLVAIYSAVSAVSASLTALSATVSGLVTGVSSVFGRPGAVTAQAGDYAASQVTNDASGVTGTHVSNALVSINTQVATNTSNIATNTSNIATLNARSINTAAPLTGGGNLSADRTLSMPAATSSNDGYMTAAYAALFDSLETVEVVSGGTYTLVAADLWKTKVFTNASGCTITIPVGVIPYTGRGWVTLRQGPSAGQLIFSAGAGVTFETPQNRNAKSYGPSCDAYVAGTQTNSSGASTQTLRLGGYLEAA